MAIEQNNCIDIIRLTKNLSADELSQLRRLFVIQTGNELIQTLETDKFSYLSKYDSPELYSLDQVYQKACEVEQLDATAVTFALTKPKQLVGELLRSMLQNYEDYHCYLLEQLIDKPLEVLEIMYTLTNA